MTEDQKDHARVMTPDSAQRLASAYDRGDSAAYYRRNDDPNIWIRGANVWGKIVIEEADMTPREIAAFYKGARDNNSGEKDWR